MGVQSGVILSMLLVCHHLIIVQMFYHFCLCTPLDSQTCMWVAVDFASALYSMLDYTVCVSVTRLV